MSQNSGELLAIYVEGETKTGKGAASEAIAKALITQGVSVYYDVAGDFFRRYMALVRRELQLGEDAPAPPRAELDAVAAKLYANGSVFAVDPSLGDLQRPAISRSVSLLGELPVAQRAAVDWYEQSVKQAHEANAEVMVLDGRNPRRHVEQHVRMPGVTVKTILDLYMLCDTSVAAQRVLWSEGVSEPTAEQLAPIMDTINHRRALDRERTEWPFWWPEQHVEFTPGEQSVPDAIAQSWVPSGPDAQPLPIVIDNSYVSKPVMWAAVAELALTALAMS